MKIIKNACVFQKLLAILLLLTTVSFSQSLLSVRYPTGTTFPLTTAAARMGGAGAGLSEPYLISSINPANLGTIRQSVYTLSMNADRRWIHEGDESVLLGSFSPSFIGFAFPMGGAGTLAANFRQSGSNRFAFQEIDTFVHVPDPGFPGKIQNIEVWPKFDRHLTFSSWELGWGIELFRRLSLGLTYQFGQYQNRSVRSDVLHTTGVISSLDSLQNNQMNSALSGGFLLRIRNLGFGVSAIYPFMGDLKSQRTIRGLVQDQNGNFSIRPGEPEREFDTTYSLQLPPSGIIGASWTFNQRLRTALDFSLVMWDSYYWSDAPTFVFEEGMLQNALGISAGVEFIPQPNLLSARYFQTVHYSGGLAFRQLPIDGDWEGSFSLGLGLPLGGMGIVDISVETGLRRSAKESDIRENFIRLNFGMSGGRVWRRSTTQL